MAMPVPLLFQVWSLGARLSPLPVTPRINSSKNSIFPDTLNAAGTTVVDFSISTDQPMSPVDPHTPEVQEQNYHVTEESELMLLDDAERFCKGSDDLKLLK